MHHGGSGTVGAAVRAGKPQIICPFHFDQSYWADQMHWLGVAPSPSISFQQHPQQRDANKQFELIRAAIAFARLPSTVHRAESLALLVAAARHPGLETAAAAIVGSVSV
eukprot:c12821_g1_i4.p1 GENE.c12821_g1_i4~~c12821_g1_i4.p1  ORF type:complete len:109 (+),score=13.40 c12821_g1_i4:1286-1612(+)